MSNDQLHNTAGANLSVSDVSLDVAASNQITISGSGFGVGPDILIADRFESVQLGQQMSVTADHGGDWLGAPVSFNDYPYTTEFKGVRCVKHYHNSDRYGMAKVFPVPSSDRFISYKVATPDGNTFPGAAVERTFPTQATVKINWLSDSLWNPSGPGGKSDLIVFSHAGSGWLLAGGNSRENISINAGWQWDEWNQISCLHKSDEANPEGLAGVWDFTSTNSAGTHTNGRNTAFQAFEGSHEAGSLSFNRSNTLAWSGGGDHSNSQLYYAKHYEAIGVNAGCRVALFNNADYFLSTDTDIIPHDSWSDTEIKITPTTQELAGKTHYAVFDRFGAIQQSGAL